MNCFPKKKGFATHSPLVAYFAVQYLSPDNRVPLFCNRSSSGYAAAVLFMHFRGRRDYSGLMSFAHLRFRKGQGRALAHAPSPYGSPLRRLTAASGGLAPRKWGGRKGGLHEDGLSSVWWQVCFHGHVYG